MQILSGHISPETAYICADYPYGFRLRCKIRYWLDSSPNKGTRLVSQTTNPKVSGEIWNKPKASTYCRFGGTMFLDENNHVSWTGCHEYMDYSEVKEWGDKYKIGLPGLMLPVYETWLKAKEIYEKAKVLRANLNP